MSAVVLGAGLLALAVGLVLLVKSILVARAAGRMPVGYDRADEHMRSAKLAFVAVGCCLLASTLTGVAAVLS